MDPRRHLRPRRRSPRPRAPPPTSSSPPPCSPAAPLPPLAPAAAAASNLARAELLPSVGPSSPPPRLLRLASPASARAKHRNLTYAAKHALANPPPPERVRDETRSCRPPMAATPPKRRDPLRAPSSNAGTGAAAVARPRGPPQVPTAEKENQGPEKDEEKEVMAPSLKPSSLQVRMEGEAELPVFVGSRGRELLAPPPPPPSSSYEAWDLFDNEAAPAASWATLPNRALLCQPLRQDVGRCTCVIAREAATGARGVALYSLYTNG